MLPVTIIFGLITYRANEQLIASHTDRFVQKTLSDHGDNAEKAYPEFSNGRYEHAASAYA
jgi:hypothetical protein